jgi:alkylated DNA repair dioxygenase AlkB
MDEYKQYSLFNNENKNSFEKDHLNIDYVKNYFNEEESIYFLQTLKDKIKWNQDYIKFYGKTHPLPRLTAWYGDRNKGYTYSGIPMTPNSWNTELLELKKRVDQYANINFNSVLLNFYRSGNDSVSWHSDDEKELGAQPIIGSVSFGGIRKFRLRNKKNKKLIHNIELENGSLLIMSGLTQKYWEHEIPKTKKKVAERVNLTFRSIL